MNNGYKFAIFVLVCIIFAQGLFILFGRKPHRRQTNIRPPVPVQRAVPHPQTREKNAGKIALVLDDWGYNHANVAVAEQIKYPLTLSVLPNLPYSKSVADTLHAHGFEIILHLPMEPKNKRSLESKTVLINMDKAAVTAILDEAILNFPYIKGVSNHMGSRATEHIGTMSIIAQILHARHMYFLDSFVTSASVARQAAAAAGIPFARRDIFIDNQLDPAYIRQQLNKLKMKAKVNGFAVGIGHDRKNTLAVLSEWMPQMAAEGYTFVYVSDLVQ